jgi:hypothetical protein
VADRGLRISWLDRVLIGIAPRWGQRRIEARARVQLMARHYEAAQIGRRTSGWQRTSSDANIANGTRAPRAARALARPAPQQRLGQARHAGDHQQHRRLGNPSEGEGSPEPRERPSARGARAVERLGRHDACDYDGRLNFYGLQRLAMETIAESGEVLILRQPAATADELAIPMRLQVLEPTTSTTAATAW